MTEHVYWTIDANINPGKYDDLVAVCKAASENTKKVDPGAIHYEWWVNADKTKLHLHERYSDSAAVMGHMAGAAEAIGKLMGCISINAVTVYGSPSADVRAAFADFKPTYFTTSMGGFSR